MRSRSISLAVVVALVVAMWSGTARADLNDPIHNGVKGAVGLGLLGADITLIIEGALRVRNPWLLTLIPIAVAGGGAAGGWFAGGGNRDDQGLPTVAVPLLVAGIALIIPAAILVAHGRSYHSGRDQDEGFRDTTEEGGPLPSSGFEDDDIPSGETRTEVVGPEEGDEAPPEAEEATDPPPAEEESGGPSAIRLDAPIPVGGMLRVMAEERARLAGLQLSLSSF